MSEHDVDRTVRELRDEIAAVDRAILDDVNARIELVAKIRSYKADAGLPFVDRDRERELIEALGAAECRPALAPTGCASSTRTCSISRSARSARDGTR